MQPALSLAEGVADAPSGLWTGNGLAYHERVQL